MSFAHLHLHTEYSLLDGLTQIKPLINHLKENGMNSCAITDHGNMYGAVEFYKTCKKNNLKPIIGCEVYYSLLGRFDKSAASRKNPPLVLLAKDQTGYQNLMKLVSLAHIEGFYYKPRIDWELLNAHHQGLICLSGCNEGELSQLILNDKYETAKKRAKDFQQLFGDDYYLEVQRHPGLPDSQTLTTQLVKLIRELSIPSVATNDSHYLS